MRSFLHVRQFFVGLILLISGGSFAQTSISDCNLGGWSAAVSGSSSVSFVNGPSPAPMGTGSLKFTIDAGGSSAELGNFSFHLTSLANLTSLSYSAYSQSGGSAGNAPYIVLQVDRNNDGAVDDYLYFQPFYQNSTEDEFAVADPTLTPAGQWVSWDALNGLWWSQSEYDILGDRKMRKLSTIIANSPDPVIRNTNDLAGIAISAGGAGTWSGFNGNADKFTIGVNGNSTVYNFESCTPDADSDGDTYLDSEDCAPNDNTRWRMGTFFVDADGDGYDAGQATVCYGASVPVGYSTSTKGTDCDDNNADAYPQIFYRDFDADGYGDALNTTTACIAPAGYVNNNWDCNDYSSTTTPSNEQVMMCKDGKSSCVTVKDVTEKEKLGWTLGPCSNYTPCDEGRTLMCHNGKPTCVKNIDVQKRLEDKSGEWKMYPCDPASTTARVNRITITPEAYTLRNYPNPLNNFTRIEYSLSADSKVSLRVFDMVGREISVLVNADQNAGTYMVDYNASKLSTGVYYYKLTAVVNGVQHEQTQKMIVSH